MRPHLVSLLFLLAFSLPAAAQFEQGVHYHPTGVAAPAARDAVEVVEAFAYPCPACRSFLPLISEWESNRPDYVAFRRLPIVLQPGWDLYARAYYTAQVIGLGHEAHEGLFRALHDQGQRIASVNDLARFYANYGVEPDTFTSTAQSFAVDSRMRQNRNEVGSWGVRSTPTMIINGKWRVSPRRGSTYEELLAVVDYLVAREAEELGLGPFSQAQADEEPVEAGSGG